MPTSISRTISWNRWNSYGEFSAPEFSHYLRYLVHTMIRTIGIDPGSRYTGYGIIEGDGSRLRHIGHGTIKLPGKAPFAERLKIIFEELGGVIERYNPVSLAIEEVFFAKNVKSALLLGQARGAALLAGINAGLSVHEYSPLAIKLAVVGYGKAGKDQVSNMIRHLFRLAGDIDLNASDAMAVAVCHLNTSSSQKRWQLSDKS
jgi:crossover junction endodeoxyribonuclease RuvC